MIGANGFIGPCLIGLDYNAAYIVAKILNIEVTPAILFKLQALERYEINHSSERSADNGCI